MGPEEVIGLVERAASRHGSRILHVRWDHYGDPEPGPRVESIGLSGRLAEALRSAGVERLYKYQYEALELARRGESIIISSGTSTGKTEAFLVPVLDRILGRGLASRGVRALILYPTKALARDQVIRVKLIAEGMLGVRVGVLDGDTPVEERLSVYSSPPEILITNPDTIHYGLAFSGRMRRLLFGRRNGGVR